jgi:hypothetical protein
MVDGNKTDSKPASAMFYNHHSFFLFVLQLFAARALIVLNLFRIL